MDPNQDPSNQVQGQVPQPQIFSAPPATTTDQGKNKPNTKIFISAGVAVAILIAITIVALLLGGSEPESVPEEAVAPQTSQPMPATQSSVEQINNSLSQDLSTIDDATDFPENQLSDENIDL